MRYRIFMVKSDARQFLLENRYRAYVAPLLLLFCCELAAGFLPTQLFSGSDLTSSLAAFAASFILNVLLALVEVGLIKISLDLMDGNPTKSSLLFYAFSHHSDSFAVVALVCMAIRTLLSCPVIYLNLQYSGREVDIYYYVYYALCTLAASLVYIIVTIRLVWAYYFILDEDAENGLDAIKKSLAFTKGRTFELLYLKFSFIPLYILSYLSLLSAFLYTRPYMETACAKYYREHK